MYEESAEESSYNKLAGGRDSAMKAKRFFSPIVTPQGKEDIQAIRYLIGIGCLYYILKK